MELIDRAALGVGRCSTDVLHDDYCEGWHGMLNIINNASIIDAVPVTRCKDCQHWTGIALGMRCKLYSFPPNSWVYSGPEDLCSRCQRQIETVLPKSDAKGERLEADQ